jgi:AcrR family transcriptional regulator
MSAKTATKTGARGWERKRANHDTYEEILEAAAQAFSRNGYDGTSLAEIARAVGIKTPALYYHFKSKNEILYAYLVRSGEHIFSAVQMAVIKAGDDPKKRLCAYVKAYIRTQLEMIDTMPTINTVIFSATVSKALTRSQYKWIQDWERKMIGLVRDILEDGKKTEAFEFINLAPTAFFLMGSIDFVVNWYRPGGSLTIADLASEYADLALASVKG